MEVKIRIVEISPKLKSFKNNPKDIISISFISDNYSVKIEDLDKAILSNDKIIINLKELKESKNNNIFQPIKYSLIRNNNSILSTGEFTPTEGVKWYKLNEIKNNISKESLVTSSTSNGNIKNNNNTNKNRRTHNLSDSHNAYSNEPMSNYYSKNNFNQLTNSSALTILKIKFSINFLNKNANSNNNNNHNLIKKNTKEASESSSKYDEIIFDKDIFGEEDNTITELDNSKLNQKNKGLTTSKKFNNQTVFSNGIQSKKISKKKIDFITLQNQKILGGLENSNNAKTIVANMNNKALSPLRKTNNSKTKKFLNEDIRMKTSMGFNKVKRVYEENENKEISKKSSNNINDEIPRKINSSERIEDEIFDQNFKNYLKNDEILKSSRTNSNKNVNQNNGIKEQNNQNTFNTNANDILQPTDRSKITNNNDINLIILMIIRLKKI